MTRPPFATIFGRARCLIPADGFYEWQTVTEEPTEPHFISLESGEPFAFAGVWTSSIVDGMPLETFAIITTEASSPIRFQHERMPVIIPHDRYITWLSPDTAIGELLPLLRPFPAEELQCAPVSVG